MYVEENVVVSYCSGIYLEVVRKITKNPQSRRSVSDPRSEPVISPEYEVRLLITRP
jgi:hypothetical protein